MAPTTNTAVMRNIHAKPSTTAPTPKISAKINRITRIVMAVAYPKGWGGNLVSYRLCATVRIRRGGAIVTSNPTHMHTIADAARARLRIANV